VAVVEAVEDMASRERVREALEILQGLDTRLGWNFATGTFIPLMKGMAGFFVDRQKSLSISAWYQATLTQAAASLFFKYEIGMGLAYFFDW
jgi:hypothetical protein